MNEETIIAVLVLCFIFGLLALAYYKRGIDDLTKMWSFFGPIAGAIMSFYFATKTGDAKLQAVNAQKQLLTSNYTEALNDAEDANQDILSFEQYINKNSSNNTLQIKSGEEAVFRKIIEDAREELKSIETQKNVLSKSALDKAD